MCFKYSAAFNIVWIKYNIFLFIFLFVDIPTLSTDVIFYLNEYEPLISLKVNLKFDNILQNATLWWNT